MEKVIGPEDNPNQDEYTRLKTLYLISKKLSTFKSIDESFGEIVSCASESFPLLTAVLIEHWEQKPKTAIWFSAEATKAQVTSALLNAKANYSYISGASEVESDEFLHDFSIENELARNQKTRSSDGLKEKNYIFLPLMIDNLPPLGAIQLEGAIPLDETDLEFVEALTNLVTVALDRFYKTKKERLFMNDLVIERSVRENFVSLLTHDLKSPLSVIMGAAELIWKRKDTPEPSLKLAEIIVRKCKQAVKMINNLLDANKIRIGQKLVLGRERINLNSLVEEAMSDLKMVHGDRFKLIADHAIEISCDPDGIKRILENLCNNAVKYGSLDEPVEILIEENLSNVFLKVHNQGPVISPEEQKLIFKQFHRSSNVLQHGREGWGIGLTLVRGVAEAHGGSVEVESSLEEGTTFTVKIPKPTLLN
jgi:signal transduction histidine kinase